MKTIMRTIAHTIFKYFFFTVLLVCVCVQLYAWLAINHSSDLSMQMFLPASFLAYVITSQMPVFFTKEKK